VKVYLYVRMVTVAIQGICKTCDHPSSIHTHWHI